MVRILRSLQILNKYYIVALLITMFLGVFFPSASVFFEASMKWIIALCMFFMGLTIDLKEIKEARKIIAKVFFGVLISCFVMPAVAWVISLLIFDGDIESVTGLMLLSTSIPALSTTVWTAMSLGYTFLSAATLLASAVTVTVSMPLITYTALGSSIVTEPIKMFEDLLTILFIPFMTAVSVKVLQGNLNPTLVEFSHIVSRLAIILIVFGNITIVWTEVTSAPLSKMCLSLIAVCTYCFLGFSIGFFTPRYILHCDERTSITLSYTSGMRDCAVSIAIAVTQFTPLTSLPATLYVIIQQLAASIVSTVFNSARSVSSA